MKIIIPLVVVSVIGATVFVANASNKTEADKLDPIKALKISRDVARIAEVRAKIAQLNTMSAQLSRDIQPTGQELQKLSKEAKINVDDLLTGCSRVEDDGTVVRKTTKIKADGTIATQSDGQIVCEDPKPSDEKAPPPKK